MISLFLNRVFRSIKIEPEVFDEVQKDKHATLSAALVVIISSSAAGIGASHLGMTNFFLAPILSLVSWFVWSYIVYVVGVKFFPDPKTKATHANLLRAIGFSSAPGIIRVLSFNSELMTVTFIGSAFWMLVCMVVAVRQTLQFKSLWKAFGVVLIAWLLQALVLIIVLTLTSRF
ncbi:MAG: hypothetical protein VW577_05295 [Pelagibacteraceae bacterium]|jgi:hypothetical protein